MQCERRDDFVGVAQISKEEEELQKARLSVRRGMPIKSMDDLERSRRRGSMQGQGGPPQQQPQQPPPQAR